MDESGGIFLRRQHTHKTLRSSVSTEMDGSTVPTLLNKSTTISTARNGPDFKQQTLILHRTPWRPPVGVSAERSYITLEDGRTVYDAVGGAAVSCLGNSHPKVIQALKDQIDKVPCECVDF